jgi:hypothetical protein
MMEHIFAYDTWFHMDDRFGYCGEVQPKFGDMTSPSFRFLLANGYWNPFAWFDNDKWALRDV